MAAVKRGPLTSEFWVTVPTILALILVAAGYLTAEDARTVIAGPAAVGAGIAAAGYALGRSILKANS